MTQFTTRHDVPADAGAAAEPAASADIESPAPGLVAVPGLHTPGPALRRHAGSDPLGGSDVPGAVATELQRRRGGGSALPDDLSGPLAQHFEMDLSDVRVHTDSGAGALARSIDAAAFTHGNDIYFAPGAYRPGSSDGQRMLAHELGHVAAQRSGADTGTAGSLRVGRADDPAEAAADRAADRAMTALRRTRTQAGDGATAAGEADVGPSDVGPMESVGVLDIRRFRWPWQSKSKDKTKGKTKDTTKGTTTDTGRTSPGTGGSVVTVPPPITTGTVDIGSSGGTGTGGTTGTVRTDTTTTESKDTSSPTTDTTPETGTGGTTGTVQTDTTTTESKDTSSPTTDTTPEMGTPAPTMAYPRVLVIDKERIEVGSAEEEQEANDILTDLQTSYGLNLSSAATIRGIKKEYGDVPKSVTAKLRRATWTILELRALSEAASYYAPILGTKREESTLKGTVQGVITIGKLKNAIDQDDAKGKLDSSTLGEYFSTQRNMGMFSAGTNALDKNFVRPGEAKTDVQTSLTSTAIHEMAHGLVQPTQLTKWIAALDYWSDENTKSGKSGAEAPPTSYGRSNAAEDLCESVSMYFINRETLKTKCPKREKFIDAVVKGWTPEQKTTVIDTTATSPGTEQTEAKS